MHHVWLAIKIAHCTRAKVVCAVLRLLWLSLHFLLLCVYLEKKCFTVSIGDGKVGDTAVSNREESYQEICF